MNTSINSQLVNDDLPVNVLIAVKRALSKFPRVRKPLDNAQRVVARARAVRPKVFYRVSATNESPRARAKRVKRELLYAGVTIYGLMKSESRYLPKILHANEHVEAVIYGQHNASSAMLVATDERIIYLDKKPMVELFDEVSYEVISGIEFDIHLLYATVVLHTPVKNYDFKFVNVRCAEKFARHIEKHRLERESKDNEPDIEVADRPIEGTANRALNERNDMAGYYWLPTDEEERQRIQRINI